MQNCEQPIAAGLLDDGHRVRQLELRIDAPDVVRERWVWRADDSRGGERNPTIDSIWLHRVFIWSDKPQCAVVLVAMETRFRQRRRGGQLGLWRANPVVVAAESELPVFIHLRATAGSNEVPPWNESFHNPTMVPILPAVEGAVQANFRFHVELVGTAVTFVAAVASLWQEHVQHCPRRVHLEFVVAGLVVCRFEEELENVVTPGAAIALLNFSVKVRVLHF